MSKELEHSLRSRLRVPVPVPLSGEADLLEGKRDHLEVSDVRVEVVGEDSEPGFDDELFCVVGVRNSMDHGDFVERRSLELVEEDLEDQRTDDVGVETVFPEEVSKDPDEDELERLFPVPGFLVGEERD